MIRLWIHAWVWAIKTYGVRYAVAEWVDGIRAARRSDG